jgi:hypothetical protein
MNVFNYIVVGLQHLPTRNYKMLGADASYSDAVPVDGHPLFSACLVNL